MAVAVAHVRAPRFLMVARRRNASLMAGEFLRVLYSHAATLNSSPATRRVTSNAETIAMIDLIFIATAFGFFALSVACTYGCEKLRGDSHD